jgi:two-component system cell cycle response regulator DivK
MSAQHPKDSSPKTETITVLLVEDNLHNRRIFSGILTHYGYSVVEAINGEEAVEKAQQIQPTIILMDLSLPVMDGWEATKRIKEIEELRQVPIIALTAHAMAGDEDRAKEAGCDGYLSKPISPKKLVAEVDRILAEMRH